MTEGVPLHDGVPPVNLKLTGGNPERLQKVLSLRLQDIDESRDGEIIDLDSEVVMLPTDVRQIVDV